MKRTILIAGLAVAFGLSANVAAQSTPAQQDVPSVKMGTAIQAKAASPGPSATANKSSAAANNTSQRTSIGQGKATATASAPSSYWTEDVDLQDNGNVQATDFMYDAQRGVVYAYREDDFTCPNGNPERAGILEAAYTAGNKAGRPVGSGYYVVGLNAGQCAVQKSAAYGCRLDANGNPTQCGAIAVNDATGDATISMVK